LAGLYLYGQEHLFSNQDFKNYDEKKRLAKAAKEDEKNQVTLEMARLRKEARMPLLFPILNERSDFNDNIINIMFHNIATYRRKYDYLNTDFACKNCDILLLSECHTMPDRDNGLVLDDFRMIRMSGTNDPNSASGQVCLLNKKSSIDNFEFVIDNTANGLYRQTKNHLELSLFKFTLKDGTEIYLCHVYNHPNNPRRSFWNEIKTFLRQNLQTDEDKGITSNLFVMGDFNIDLKKDDSIIQKFANKLGLYTLHQQVTTDRNTCIDWCLSNVDSRTINYGGEVYESFFSDHKPIVLKIQNV
jgi:hypothetical protein